MKLSKTTYFSTKMLWIPALLGSCVSIHAEIIDTIPDFTDLPGSNNIDSFE